MPFFQVHGAPLANMASFKAHCAFGFWKASVMEDPKKLFAEKEAMGSLGKLTTVDDLPADKVLLQYLKHAASLNEQGVAAPRKRRSKEELEAVETPDFLTAALKKHKHAKAQFDAFTPGKRREYILWFTEAKTEATRNKRVAEALPWIAEGKGRNWKYEKK